MKGEIPIPTIIGVLAALLLLIIGFYYLYTNIIPSQKTLTEQKCDVLLNTACQAYLQGTSAAVAFKNVPKECLGEGLGDLLDDCKNDKTDACRSICEVGWVGEIGELGAI
jgi:hypothetical protein